MASSASPILSSNEHLNPSFSPPDPSVTSPNTPMPDPTKSNGSTHYLFSSSSSMVFCCPVAGSAQQDSRQQKPSNIYSHRLSQYALAMFNFILQNAEKKHKSPVTGGSAIKYAPCGTKGKAKSPSSASASRVLAMRCLEARARANSGVWLNRRPNAARGGAE